MMNKKALEVLVWIVGFQLISSFSSWIGSPSKTEWYGLLQRSSLTPPGYIFSIVWFCLYVMLAVVGWLIYASKFKKPYVKELFAVQMILNWLWSPLFFALHAIGFSFFVIGVMIALTVGLIVRLKSSLRIAAYLLMPYLCWICFAFYLNGYIWLYN